MNTNNPFEPGRDFTEVKNKASSFMKKWLKYIIILLAAAVFALNCFYTLHSSEKAVITRLGRYIGTQETAGLKFKIPFIDKQYIVNTGLVRSLEFGFRSSDPSNTSYEEIEGRMITGDLNIVIADWAILYQIDNPYNYIFKVQDPETTLRIISESTYRRVVASHPLDNILTNQKDVIQREILSDLQSICDKYEIGVIINAVQLQDAMPPQQVNDSFQEVTRAKEQKEAMINEASKYENEQLPVARGEASKLVYEAEGYREKRINDALGAVARYKSIEAEYINTPDIMRTRLYIEMIKEVLPGVKDIYITDSGGDLLKFLPIGSNS